MKTTNTFSVLFLVKANKGVTEEGIIYARITMDQKRVLVNLKRKISLDLWDSSTKRAKGHSVQAKRLNQFLDLEQSRFLHCYQELLSKGKKVTANLIKASFLGEEENSKTLQEIIGYHARKIEKTMASSSIRNYGVTEGYINKFLIREKNTSDVFLKELDYKFLYDFDNFLQEYYPKKHSRVMSPTTVMEHIQRLRKVVTMAYHLEWIDKDPFIRWKTTYEKREREFLSAKELSNLKKYKFPLERLNRVRDLFVFSCYTGIRYVDVMGLSLIDISTGIDGAKWIFTKRQKTETPIKVPLPDPALKLIKKYENHPETQLTGSLLPQITNEKLNVYLKEVAILCGIKKNLTFPMARHTFATTVTLSKGVSIETVAKLLGHTKIATTQIYARLLENKANKDMNNLREDFKLRKN